MATTAPSWFNESVYMANKLKQLQASEPAANWTDASMAKAFVDAGYGADNVYQHFLEHGKSEDISPVSEFNVSEYYTAKAMEFYKLPEGTMPTALQYETIKNLIHEVYPEGGAWEHYDKHGMEEGINPSNGFDVSGYMEAKLALMVAKDPKYTMKQLVTAFEENGYTPLSHYLTYKGQTGEVAKDKKFDVPADEKVTPPAGAGETGQTFTLTAGQDTVNGGVNDDLVMAPIVDGKATLTPGDTIDGGAGNDTLKIFGGSFDGVDVKNVETFEMNGLTFGTGTGNFAATLDASEYAGLNTVNFVKSTGVFTLDNLTDDFTVGLAGKGLGAANVLTTNFDATATTANIVVDKLTAVAQVMMSGKGLTTVNLAGTTDLATKSFVAVTDTLNTVTTVNIESAGGAFGLKGTKIATIDASASTGDLYVDASAGIADAKVAKTVTLGSGNDQLWVNIAEFSKTDKIDMGAGDKDIAGFQFTSNGGAAVALDATAYSVINAVQNAEIIGFDVKGLTTHTTNGLTFDASKITSADTFDVMESATITGLTSDQTVISSTTGKTFILTQATLIEADGADRGTINLVAQDKGELTTVAAASAFGKLVITGEGNAVVGGTNAAGITIDGSAMTGTLTATGTIAGDVITVGSGGSTVIGGKGADKITFGAGADVASYIAVTDSQDLAGVGGVDMDKIYNFGTTDKITTTNLVTTDRVGIVKFDYVDDGQGNLWNLPVGNKIFGASGSEKSAAYATYTGSDGQEYTNVYIDVNSDGAYNGSDDMVIQLVGNITLTDDNVVIS